MGQKLRQDIASACEETAGATGKAGPMHRPPSKRRRRDGDRPFRPVSIVER
jgi:hypothetical protein